MSKAPKGTSPAGSATEFLRKKSYSQNEYLDCGKRYCYHPNHTVDEWKVVRKTDAEEALKIQKEMLDEFARENFIEDTHNVYENWEHMKGDFTPTGIKNYERLALITAKRIVKERRKKV